MACLNLLCNGEELAKIRNSAVQCFSCDSKLCKECENVQCAKNQIHVCSFCSAAICYECLPVDMFIECHHCAATYCNNYGECESLPGKACNVCEVFVCNTNYQGCKKIVQETWENCTECHKIICEECVENSRRCEKCAYLIGDCCEYKSYNCVLCGDVYCSECGHNFDHNSEQMCDNCVSS